MQPRLHIAGPRLALSRVEGLGFRGKTSTRVPLMVLCGRGYRFKGVSITRAGIPVRVL